MLFHDLSALFQYKPNLFCVWKDYPYSAVTIKPKILGTLRIPLFPKQNTLLLQNANRIFHISPT